MAEQSPYEQDASHNFIPDNFHYVDIRSYDSEYLSACVGFAQSYGMYPDGLRRQQNTSFPYGIPLTLPPPFNQHHSNMIGHQYLGSSKSNGEYANPYISNTLADLNYTQHSHGNHPDRFLTSRDDDTISENGDIDDVAHYSRRHVSSPSTVTQGSPLSSEPPPPTQLPEDPSPASQLAIKSDTRVLGLAVRYNYDHFWLQKIGGDPDSVLELPSKMSFESLFYEGVIQKGDRLVIAVKCNMDGVVRQDVATLTHTGFSKALVANGRQKDYPDLTLTLRHAPLNYCHPIAACKGTNVIADVFHQLFMNANVPRTDIADHMNVWRADRDLGSLKFVKHAYQTWRNEMDNCMDKSWRARRRKADITGLGMGERKDSRIKGKELRRSLEWCA